MAASKNGDEQFFEHALLADDALGQLAADAPVAVVEPFDGRQFAFDARPGCVLIGGQRFEHGHIVFGQPRSAAAQPPAAGRNLHEEAAVGAFHGYGLFVGLHGLQHSFFVTVPEFGCTLARSVSERGGLPR